MRATARAVLSAAAIAVAACTYGPPAYHGKIDSAAVLDDGRVALSYSQMVARPPTGIATFPDGGISRVLYDRFVIALVDPDGRTRELARFANTALPGNGNVHVAWYTEDPQHVYVTRSGQLTTSTPLRWLHQTVRMDLNGHSGPSFDIVRELKQRGRAFGAKDFGGDRPIDSDGDMLVGATHGADQEIWLRSARGAWRQLARFDRDASIVGDDIVYTQGDYQYALNWRTSRLRPIVHFNRSTQQSEIIDRDDPALRKLRNPDIARPAQAFVSDDRHGVRINRENRFEREVRPDLTVLDRR